MTDLTVDTFIDQPARVSAPGTASWTCPFCPLLCDAFSVKAADKAADKATPRPALALVGSTCPRARAALAQFTADAAAPQPLLKGKAASLDDAIAAAARVLAASRLPLFGGLATDVAGARALYALASATGAVSDAAHGAAATQALRALQDRGGYTTTLAEIKARADLMVCIGAVPTERFPEFDRRCGIGFDGGSLSKRDMVVIGADGDGDSDSDRDSDSKSEGEGDLFATVACLAALVAGLAVRDAPEALRALSARLHAARYAVLVYETGRLPPHGALVIEAIHRTVATLNRTTRAAAFALGSDAGEATASQVFTWLSGLPLRSRSAPAGQVHEPQLFDAARLLKGNAVDALLWVSSFTADEPPPPSTLPRIVLGHPGLAAACAEMDVFIPVSTPGIGSAGHLFRGDGSVMLPLQRVLDDGLPTVAAILIRLRHALTKAAA